MTADEGQLIPVNDSLLQSNKLDSFPAQLTDMSTSLIIELSSNTSAATPSAPTDKKVRIIDYS